MAIIATGAKTIIDLSDGKSLSIHLESNLPKIQLYNTNTGEYSPNWVTPPHLIVGPVLYLNQQPLGLTTAGLSLSWYKKIGVGTRSAINFGPGNTTEILQDGVLVVTENSLNETTSKSITYILDVDYLDPDTNSHVLGTADVSFSLVSSGANAKTIDISGEQVFKYADGAVKPTPESIVLYASVAGTTIQTWKYWNVSTSTWTNVPNGGAGVTSITVGHNTANYWSTSNLCKIRCYVDNGNLYDEFTLIKIIDGTNPISGYLTNESITLEANKDGVVTPAIYATATGIFKVTDGTTEVPTGNITFTRGAQTNCTAAISSTGVYTVSAMSADTASVVFTALANKPGAPTITKILSLAKSRQGIQGPQGQPGSNAKTLNITTSSDIFTTNSSGVLSPDWIKFTANKQNTTATVTWATSPACPLFAATTGGTATTQGDVVYMRRSDFGSKDSVVVTASSDGLVDTATIINIREGLSAVVPVVSNDSFTLPASTAGVVSSYVNSGTKIQVYEGANLLTFTTGTLANSQFSIGTPLQVPESTLTIGGRSGNGTTTATVAVHSAMANATDSVTIEYPLTIKRANGSTTTLSAFQNLTKSKAGAIGPTGTPASLVSIGASAEAFSSTNGGVSYTPAAIELIPVFQTVTGGIWEYSVNGGTSWLTVVTGANGHVIAGDKLTITALTAPYTTSVNAITYRKKTSGTVTDQVTIPRLVDGVDSIHVILDNENFTMSKPTVGAIDYSDSGTKITVYEGATELTSVIGATAAGQWTATMTATNITGQSLVKSGTAMTAGPHKAMTQKSAKIVYNISGKRRTGQSFTTTTTQTFSLSEQGLSAVTFSIYAPQGDVFQNRTGADKTLAISAYDGATAITAPTSYKWYKYSAGSWGAVIGTTNTLTITAASVLGSATFKCDMVYGGNTYTDTYTFQDKTDNYQADIESTAGDVFKNKQGSTVLTCVLSQNGVRVDETKTTGTSPFYSATPPGSPVNGDFFYQYTSPNYPMVLKKYNGSAWVVATGGDAHIHTYTWYARNKDGVPMNSGASIATGKTIFVDHTKVDTKAIFTCEVS